MQRRHAALGRHRRVDLFGIEAARPAAAGAAASRRRHLAATAAPRATASTAGLQLRRRSARLVRSLPTQPFESPCAGARRRARSSADSCFGRSMVLLVTFASAPRLISGLIASTRFCEAAKISGVCPHSASRALTSALRRASSGDDVHVARRRPRGGAASRRSCSTCASTSAPALSSALHHGGAARLGGQVQRRVVADARDRVDVGAGVDQHLGQLGVAALGRPVQRRHAVALRGADVGALLEQRLHGGGVAAHGGVGHRRADWRRTQRRRQRARRSGTEHSERRFMCDSPTPR